ncbi:MAG: LamB/YcsF family protein, partial [Chloroflexi bacterium]
MNLNADIGEGAGEDEAILACVDSANIACGVHAGSASLAIATAWRCRKLGIEVGAHPGYDDRAGFGRVERSLGAEDIEALIAFQVAGLAAVTPIAYVKPHGALYHRCQRDPAAADALARVAKAHAAGLVG